MYLYCFSILYKQSIDFVQFVVYLVALYPLTNFRGSPSLCIARGIKVFDLEGILSLSRTRNTFATNELIDHANTSFNR